MVECLLQVTESCGFPGMLGTDCMHWQTLISGMLCLELLDQTMKKPLDLSFHSMGMSIPHVITLLMGYT